MGRVWKFNNSVNTDEIIAGRFYPREDITSLGDFCLSEIRPDFSKNKKKGDVIVAGKNFGCGSSREYAVLALKYSGISCIIAESFARIFFRNSINLGLKLLVLKNASEFFDESDEVVFQDSSQQILTSQTSDKTNNIQNKNIVNNQTIINLTKKKSHNPEKFPEFISEIINSGGIIQYINAKNKQKS